MYGWSKQKTAAWNWQILEGYMDHDDIEIEVFTEHHVRITRKRDGAEMDFWPSTNRALWKIKGSHSFDPGCLFGYLNKKFFSDKNREI